jgi:hypothetical protein
VISSKKEKEMGKRNEGNGDAVFAPLTIAENMVLRTKLMAGRESANHVHGDYGFSREMHEVHSDLSEAYRVRWNAENPDFPIEE